MMERQNGKLAVKSVWRVACVEVGFLLATQLITQVHTLFFESKAQDQIGAEKVSFPGFAVPSEVGHSSSRTQNSTLRIRIGITLGRSVPE